MPVEIFCCYARRDQQLLAQLKTHLMPLQRQGLVTMWTDIDIHAGNEWESEIEKHLNTAQIILLLVSPDFIASDYCYSKEMRRAIERHERGEAYVIPIILRPTLWLGTPLGKLQALPKSAKPVTEWRSRSSALLSVAIRILGLWCTVYPSNGNYPFRFQFVVTIPEIMKKVDIELQSSL